MCDELYKETRKWAINIGKSNLLDFSDDELKILRKYFR